MVLAVVARLDLGDGLHENHRLAVLALADVAAKLPGLLVGKPAVRRVVEGLAGSPEQQDIDAMVSPAGSGVVR